MNRYLFFFLIVLSSVILSCSDDNVKTTPVSESNDVNKNSITNSYEVNWEILKEAIISKNKPVVMTFVSNDDPMLKEAFDISYDFIFDDELITLIEPLIYSELALAESNDSILSKRIILLEHTKNQDDSIVPTGLRLEITPTNETIKITNYTTY